MQNRTIGEINAVISAMEDAVEYEGFVMKFCCERCGQNEMSVGVDVARGDVLMKCKSCALHHMGKSNKRRVGGFNHSLCIGRGKGRGSKATP